MVRRNDELLKPGISDSISGTLWTVKRFGPGVKLDSAQKLDSLAALMASKLGFRIAEHRQLFFVTSWAFAGTCLAV